MPDNNREQEDKGLQAPPQLIAVLKRSSKGAVLIPPTVDEAILHAAHRHLSRQKEPHFKWLRVIRWGIAAVAVVLLLAIAPQFLRKTGSVLSPRLVRRDLNHDGQVDILDAFALARELKSGAHPGPRLDINGDGVVDERDVAALAARAVSLAKGGRS